MVVCDEPKPRSVWNGERIKQFTGSKVTARGVHAKTEISFAPRGKLIVECNQLPKPPSDDRGFRRRHKIIPFTIQFGVTPGVADAPVHEVKAQLMAEQSGILNWMVAGAVEWLNERVIPEAQLAKAASDSYWSGASVMSDFLKDCCDLSDRAALTGATELYNAFRAYRIAAGDDEKMIMKQSSFGSALTNLQLYGCRDSKTGRKVRQGIRLLVEEAVLASPGADAAPAAPVDGYDVPW
jgi:phage/plasmid-associated DNA primase